MTNPTPALSKAKFPFTHATLLSQLQVVQTVLEKCKTSSALPSPDPIVQTLTTTTTDLASTEQQVLTLKTQLTALLAVRDDKDLAFRKACLAFLGHINTLAQGDATIITSVGMLAQQRTLAASTTATTPTPMPTGLAATPSAKPGDVTLKWKAIKKAKSYAIERSATPAGPFVHVAVSPGRRIVLTEQPSATPLYYHVAAVVSAAQGPFCDPVAVVLR